LSFILGIFSLTEFPIALAASPYSLSTGVIGVCYLPQGVGSLIASPLFGRLSDYGAAQHPCEPEARLMYSTLSTLLIMPPSLLLYGWALDFKTNLAACLIGQFFIGAGCASYLPGIFG
jgi:MFS family permease